MRNMDSLFHEYTPRHSARNTDTYDGKQVLEEIIQSKVARKIGAAAVTIGILLGGGAYMKHELEKPLNCVEFYSNNGRPVEEAARRLGVDPQQLDATGILPDDRGPMQACWHNGFGGSGAINRKGDKFPPDRTR